MIFKACITILHSNYFVQIKSEDEKTAMEFEQDQTFYSLLEAITYLTNTLLVLDEIARMDDSPKGPE